MKALAALVLLEGTAVAVAVHDAPSLIVSSVVISPELVSAVGVALVAVITAGVAGYVKIVQTLSELKRATHTANGQPMGHLAEAAESRRVSRIPVENRTQEEQEHIDAIPVPERPYRDGVTLPHSGVMVDRREEGE